MDWLTQVGDTGDVEKRKDTINLCSFSRDYWQRNGEQTAKADHEIKFWIEKLVGLLDYGNLQKEGMTDDVKRL